MKFRTLLGIGLILTVAAGAVAEAPLTDRLPGECLLYVGWAGRQKAFDGSMLGQMLREIDAAKTLAAVKDVLGERIPKGQARQILDSAWSLAAVAWERPIALAVTGIETVDGAPRPSAVLLIDLGRRRAEFARHLDAALRAAGEDLPPFQERTAGALTYKTAMTPMGALSHGYLGDTFFLSLGARMPERLAGLKAPKSLRSDPKFRKAMKGLSGENEQLSLYVDIDALLTRGEAMVRGQETVDPDASPIRGVLTALGAGKITALASAVRIVDRGLYTKGRLLSAAPHEGLLKPFASAPITDADLAGVPADTLFVGAMKLSPKAALAEIRRVLATLDKNAGQELDNLLEMASGEMDVDIEEDVIAALGDTWVLSSAPSYGGFLTGTMLTVQVKDTAKLAAAIRKIEAYFAPLLKNATGRGGLSFQTVRSGRVEIRCLAGSVGSTPMPVRPAWAIYKDRLYLAAWPQVIQSAIENNGRSPLTKSPQFQAARKRVSDKAPMLLYVNNRAILQYVYPLHLIVGTMGGHALARELGPAGEALQAALGPLPLSRVLKYAGQDITALSADAEGIVFESYGTGASPIAGLSTTAMMTAALVPALSKAKGKARRAMSMANLNSIGKGIAIYQAIYDDRSPPHLGALVTEKLIPLKMFVSPLSERAPPRLVNGKLIGEVDYVYLRVPATATGTLIQAYERPENYGGKGTAVLLVNSSVRWMDRAEFRRRLEQTRNWMKNPGQDAEDF